MATGNDTSIKYLGLRVTLPFVTHLLFTSQLRAT
jgi:hypothetical protein